MGTSVNELGRSGAYTPPRPVAGAGSGGHGVQIVPQPPDRFQRESVPMQYDNIYTPAAELDFPAPPPTRPSRRIVFREYVFGVSARAAWYGALAGLAIGVVLTALGYMLEAPWYLLTATALACTLLGAGGYGVITLNGAWRSFVAEFGHEPMPPKNKDPEGPRQGVVMSPPDPNRIKFPTLDRRSILEFETRDKRAIRRWFEQALDGNDVSLGKNDAMKHGVPASEWETIFPMFVSHGLVEERKNQKPRITADGIMALDNCLKHYI